MASGRANASHAGVEADPTTNPLADSTELDLVLPPLPLGFEDAVRSHLAVLDVLYPGRGRVTARIDCVPGRRAEFHLELGGDDVLVGRLTHVLPPAPALPPGLARAVRSHLAAVHLLHGGKGHVLVRVSREAGEKPISVTFGGRVPESSAL